MKLLNLIAKLDTAKVSKWEANSDGTGQWKDEREPADITEANVVTSKLVDTPSRHAVLLDIDKPAWLIPSSTPGHSHLYVDTEARWRDIEEFLLAAARVGLIEEGYAKASIRKRGTTLRLPWVRK